MEDNWVTSAEVLCVKQHQFHFGKTLQKDLDMYFIVVNLYFSCEMSWKRDRAFHTLLIYDDISTYLPAAVRNINFTKIVLLEELSFLITVEACKRR